MDSYLHHESHFRASDTVRDSVIGMADGLTVPFALAAATIAGACIVGGFNPIAPHLALDAVARALPWSLAITLAALAVFGCSKGHCTGAPKWKSAMQTLAIGGLAAAVAFAPARLIG